MHLGQQKHLHDGLAADDANLVHAVQHARPGQHQHKLDCLAADDGDHAAALLHAHLAHHQCDRVVTDDGALVDVLDEAHL